MLGQYLSNTNEISIIHILQKKLELNKASVVARNRQLPVRSSMDDGTLRLELPTWILQGVVDLWSVNHPCYRASPCDFFFMAA
jgi:hypothetical protein